MSWPPLFLGLLLGLGLLGGPQALGLERASAAWVVGGWFLELLAPSLPGFGFASLAPALWLGLAAFRPESVWLAVIGQGLALLLRFLLHGARPHCALGILADAQPVVLALGVSHLIQCPGLAGPCWYFLWWTQPGYLAAGLPEEVATGWCLRRVRLQPLMLALALLATLGSCCRGWLPPLILFLTLLSLGRLLPLLLAGVEAEERVVRARRTKRSLDDREAGLDRLEAGLRLADQKQRVSSAELEARLSIYRLMDRMLESIPQRPVFSEVAQMVVTRLRERFPVSNIVLFWLEIEGHSSELQPVAWKSSFADRLSSARLTRLQEPVVIQALSSGQMQWQQQQQGPDSARFFPEDCWAVGVPLATRGCFYLGHSGQRTLSPEEQYFLEVLARHSLLVLDAAAWYQTLQLSLQREAATAGRNEGLVQRLALIIDGVTQLMRLREPQAILESAGKILAPIVRHECYFAHSQPLGQTEALEVCLGPIKPEELDALRQLAQRLMEKPVPLLLEQPPRLAVPLLSDRGYLGVLILQRDKKPFHREDQDILSVLSYQLAAALASAQLYAELQRTHAALRDSQAQLLQSSKMAAVGQLAGGVAHELNTPLGAVALAVEAAQLVLTSKPERAAARLERAGKAVQQMKEIVSKLLFYSRDARTGWRQTEINQVVEDTLQLVGHQLSLDQICVVQDCQPTQPILANPNELQQVLTNLILNARDAMLAPGAQGRQLFLSTGSWDQGIWLRLRDQGCGMSSQVVERIFEPFFTTKEVGKGTGLGLSVTVQLLQQHGGSIQVESTPGEGTSFEIRLLNQPPGQPE